MLKKLVLEVDPSVKVYTASASGPAYEILMERTIDVFLVDIILDTSKPGDASGMRLVENVRKLEKYMFTPVVFITSLEDAMLAYELGYDGIIISNHGGRSVDYLPSTLEILKEIMD